MFRYLRVGVKKMLRLEGGMLVSGSGGFSTTVLREGEREGVGKLERTKEAR